MTSTPTMKSQATMDRDAADAAFASANKYALAFMNEAAADYSAARCCLLNGQFSGLQLASQAIEKTMKSYILLADPTFDPRSLSHRIDGLNETLKSVYPAAAYPDDEPLKRFLRHYNARYPTPDGSRGKSGSTGEYEDLDQIMVYLILAEPSRPARYRSGVPAVLSTLLDGSTGAIWCQWLLQENIALQAHLGALLPAIAAAFAPLP